MERVRDLFDNLDEIVYAADIDTYELYYMNKKAYKVFGIDDNTNIKGKKCYELLQGRTSPCPICTNKLLKPKEYFEWVHYNEVLGKYYSLKDTMMLIDNKRIRLEIAFDISIDTQQKKTLKTYESNERLLNEALQKALSCDDEKENSLQVFINYLGEKLDCERMYIFEEADNAVINNTYEWCAPGISPQIDNLQNVPFEVAEIWYRSFYQGKNVIIYDIEDIRETSPDMYNTLKPQQINSLIVCPIRYKDKILGFFGVDNPPLHNISHISTILDIISNFVLCMFYRRSLIRKLEKMSYYDELTGAFNRHALTRRINTLSKETNIGLIYCDVMCLKQINDRLGHNEGDSILKNSYQFLVSCADNNPIFRLGGDEFMILCCDIEKDKFFDILNNVKEQEAEQNINIAVGHAWGNLSNMDFSDILFRADIDMYKDKNQRRKEMLRDIFNSIDINAEYLLND